LDLSKNVLSPKIAILVENPSYPLSGLGFLGQTNMCIQHYNINMGKVIPKKKHENSTRRTDALFFYLSGGLYVCDFFDWA